MTASLREVHISGGDANLGGGIFNDGVVMLNGAAVTINEPNTCAGDPVAGCSEDP